MNKFNSILKTISNSYYAVLGKKYFKPSGKKITKFLINAIEKKYKQNDSFVVLEIWCNYGFTSIEIAKKFHNCKVIGFDSNNDVLGKANINAIKYGVSDRVKFLNSDLLEIDFANQKFDVIICESFLTLAQNKQKVLNQFLNLAKDDGILLTNELCFKSKTHILENEHPNSNDFIPYPLSIQSWKDLFLENNFSILDYYAGNYKFYSFIKLFFNEYIINSLKALTNMFNKKNKHSFYKTFSFITRNRKNLGFVAFVLSKNYEKFISSNHD